MSRLNRIAEYRRMVGLTQRQLARVAGIPVPTLARLDACPSAMPSLNVAIRLAKALGIDVASLVSEAALS